MSLMAMPTALPGVSRGWVECYRWFLQGNQGKEGAGVTLGLSLLLAREQREHGHWSLLAPVAVGYHCPTGMCSDLLWNALILLQDLLRTCCVLIPAYYMMSPICCGMFPS